MNMSDGQEENKVVDAKEDETGYIKLSEIIFAIVEFNGDPQNEEKYNKIVNYINAISVRERIPIREKNIILAEILTAIPADDKDDAAELAIRLELARYFFGLMKYATNLRVDISTVLLDSSVYDSLEVFGLSSRLKKFCGEDYASLCALLQDTINFRHINEIVSMASLFSEENMKDLKETVVALKTELTPEKLAQMKAIVTEGDPAWTALRETVAEKAVENALMTDVQLLAEKKGE